MAYFDLDSTVRRVRYETIYEWLGTSTVVRRISTVWYTGTRPKVFISHGFKVEPGLQKIIPIPR